MNSDEREEFRKILWDKRSDPFFAEVRKQRDKFRKGISSYDEAINIAAFFALMYKKLADADKELANLFQSLMRKDLTTLDPNAFAKQLTDIREKSLIFPTSVEPALFAAMQMGQFDERVYHAMKAADARHSKPGGSRDKRNQIRTIWASGKYSSRDICAEQEGAAIGMSFSAARKALRNAPAPSTAKRNLASTSKG